MKELWSVPIASTYRRFIGDTGLADLISAELAALDSEDVQELALVGKRIRDAVVARKLVGAWVHEEARFPDSGNVYPE
jgi:hypothetical protein